MIKLIQSKLFKLLKPLLTAPIPIFRPGKFNGENMINKLGTGRSIVFPNTLCARNFTWKISHSPSKVENSAHTLSPPCYFLMNTIEVGEVCKP